MAKKKIHQLHPLEYAKAITGAVAAGVSVLAGACGDGISAQEWLTTLAATLVAFGAVYNLPNRPPAGTPSSPDVSEQDSTRQ